jgi:acetyl-CoA carboxylase biotin carboxyl carrier protein
MNLKEIKELIALVVEKGLTEFELERSGVKVRIKRPNPAENGMMAAPLTPQVILPPVTVPLAVGGVTPAGHLPPAPAEPAAAPAPQEDLHFIKSPIVGTFYASPNPDAPPFAKPGDTVEAGQTLCIIEAMKLMNEIESDMAGEIVKCYVANSQPVEYGERLFSLRPRRKK